MKKALIGYGGHAREVMAQMGIQLPCFVDDEYSIENSLPISKFDPNEYMVMVAISDCKTRNKIVDKLPKNTKYFSWVHPTVLMFGSDIEIGHGSFIGAYSMLTTNIKIGNHSILNRANQIGHDCRIGDFFSAMPGAIVSGNVTINNRVYLGSNSSIREKLTIHDDVTIGLNTSVYKSIDKSGVYVGQTVREL